MIRCVNGFGPGLEDVELAGLAVLGPLEIHRSWPACPLRIVLLDYAGPARELQHFVVTQTKPLTLRINNFARAGSFAVEPVDHLHFLSPKMATHNRTRPFVERWLENDPFVGRSHTLNNCFSQTP